MMDPCTFQKNNCKVVFKIIPHDLEGNWCEMMALVCLNMVMVL